MDKIADMKRALRLIENHSGQRNIPLRRAINALTLKAGGHTPYHRDMEESAHGHESSDSDDEVVVVDGVIDDGVRPSISALEGGRAEPKLADILEGLEMRRLAGQDVGDLISQTKALMAVEESM